MPAASEPTILHVGQMTTRKHWERQEGESARWFLRFRNYLALGSKRSINAAYEQERKDKQVKASTKAGPEWYNAAKRYNWKIRADAYDQDQDEQKARLMQAIAAKCAYVSRPFRIAQLNSMTDTLARELEKGQDVQVFLNLTKQIQALMHDIQDEVRDWGVQIDASTDAAALDALNDKERRQSALQEERQEREMDATLAQAERLARSRGMSVEEWILSNAGAQ
jgi:hypothetical protein